MKHNNLEEIKQYLLDGNIIISERGDVGYFSNIDNEFLLRYNISSNNYKKNFNFDNLPVKFDFQYISTFRKVEPEEYLRLFNIEKNDEFSLLKNIKTPLKVLINNKHYYKNETLQQLEIELEKTQSKIDEILFSKKYMKTK